MNLSVVGSGRVGAVVAACFAQLGHHVVAVEIDPARRAELERGRAPFTEPGLDSMLCSALESGALSFTDDVERAVRSSTVVFVCVGTPAGSDGSPSMEAVRGAARSIGASIRTPQVVVTKSTVPVGTGEWLKPEIEKSLEVPLVPGLVEVVSNPEFLREGSSVDDFLHPDRIVVGADGARAREVVLEVYEPLLAAERAIGREIPVFVTELVTAEMAKYASNAFLATKISFANEMARICDLVGADITEVTAVMGADSRIARDYLDAGLGWGGSCFGKDIVALTTTARARGFSPRIVDAAVRVNDAQRDLVVDQLERHLGPLEARRVGVLGLTFKPGTDDLRDSAALQVVAALVERGAVVAACDPTVSALPGYPAVRVCAGPREVAAGADALVLATAWPEYLDLDLSDLRRLAAGTLVVDGRNALDRGAAVAAGFTYVGIGRRADRSPR